MEMLCYNHNPPSKSATPIGFPDLPPEIRERIFVLSYFREVTIGYCLTPKTPNVAAINRQLRQEALALYFAKSDFVFMITKEANHDYECYQWLSAQEDSIISCIRTTIFRFDTSRTGAEPNQIAVDVRSGTVTVQYTIPERIYLRCTMGIRPSIRASTEHKERVQEAASKIQNTLQEIQLDNEGVRRLTKSALRILMLLTIGSLDNFDSSDTSRIVDLAGLR